MDGPITDAERACFVRYARHIRTIHLRATPRIDPTVFRRLAHAHLGSPLTPQLRALYAEYGCPLYQGMAAALLSGPRLRMLSCAEVIDTDDRPPPHRHPRAPRTLIAAFAASAPHIESLQVYQCPHPSLLEPIGAMRGLRRLDVGMTGFSFGVDFLKSLTRLDRLEELVLPNKFIAQGALRCSGLKSVKKLTILGGALTIPALLAALPDVRLTELQSSMFFEDVPQLAAALSACPERCLETISLDCPLRRQVVVRKPVSALLAPFFALQGIRRFRLGSWQPLVIGNEDLQMIGDAWPKLEELRLWCYTNERHEIVAPTIEGIVELARACPGLDDVYFSTVIPDMDPGNLVPPLPTEEIQKHTLRVRIPDQLIRDVGQVTRLLHSVFGKLHIPELDRERFGKWGAVLDGMVRMQGS